MADNEELRLDNLPEEESPDYFEMLVTNCIRAFAITYSDTTALDANGVIGQMRVLVMENNRYQKETRMLRARKTIDDLSEINALVRDVTYEEDEEEEEEEEIQPSVIFEPEFVDDFDIRNPGKRRKKKEEPKIVAPPKKEKKKPRKLFDKAKIDMRLKLFQHKRDILNEEKGVDEKEGDSLNIFFHPVTAEEFESLKTIELSSGTSTTTKAFISSDEDEVAKKLGKLKDDKALMDGGSAYHYEEVDGENILVED